MTIAVYDVNTLPCITYPIKYRIEQTKRFLGGKARVGEMYATITIKTETNSKIEALYNFWKDDCNYGLDPCLFPIPLFGGDYDKDHPTLLVQLNGEFGATKNPGYHDGTFEIKILGEISYVIDDNGDFILDDSGDFVITDGILTATGNNILYRRISYGTY